MTQPEALRLADALRYGMPYDEAEIENELRRLHLELERCKQVCAATSEGWRADAEKWKDQRAVLLEALKMATKQNDHDMLMTGEELRQAYAAIAKCEENT